MKDEENRIKPTSTNEVLEITPETEKVKRETPTLNPILKMTMPGEKDPNTSLAKTENVSTLTIDLKSPLPVLKRQAELIANSGLVPVTDPEAIMIMWLTGNELGIPPMAAVNNIYVVQGKPVLNKHIVNALLQRTGWTAMIYEDLVGLENGDARTTYKFVNQAAIDKLQSRKAELAKITNDALLTSLLEDIKAQAETYTRYYSFYWSDAVNMKLDVKDNWVKMPRIMMQTRCLVLGAREIAPRALMGMYEVTEWSDAKNGDYTMDEEGQVTVLN
ncbi:MAG: hypothetical protein PF450_06685 [Bacteroidales bacterium]|jgi:hypothetical protein|nr:hypothetical protein [Bacteroidales bacterium]